MNLMITTPFGARFARLLFVAVRCIRAAIRHAMGLIGSATSPAHANAPVHDRERNAGECVQA